MFNKTNVDYSSTDNRISPLPDTVDINKFNSINDIPVLLKSADANQGLTRPGKAAEQLYKVSKILEDVLGNSAAKAKSNIKRSNDLLKDKSLSPDIVTELRFHRRLSSDLLEKIVAINENIPENLTNLKKYHLENEERFEPTNLVRDFTEEDFKAVSDLTAKLRGGKIDDILNQQGENLAKIASKDIDNLKPVTEILRDNHGDLRVLVKNSELTSAIENPDFNPQIQDTFKQINQALLDDFTGKSKFDIQDISKKDLKQITRLSGNSVIKESIDKVFNELKNKYISGNSIEKITQIENKITELKPEVEAENKALIEKRNARYERKNAINAAKKNKTTKTMDEHLDEQTRFLLTKIPQSLKTEEITKTIADFKEILEHISEKDKDQIFVTSLGGYAVEKPVEVPEIKPKKSKNPFKNLFKKKDTSLKDSTAKTTIAAESAQAIEDKLNLMQNPKYNGSATDNVIAEYLAEIGLLPERIQPEKIEPKSDIIKQEVEGIKIPEEKKSKSSIQKILDQGSVNRSRAESALTQRESQENSSSISH